MLRWPHGLGRWVSPTPLISFRLTQRQLTGDVGTGSTARPVTGVAAPPGRPSDQGCAPWGGVLETT